MNTTKISLNLNLPSERPNDSDEGIQRGQEKIIGDGSSCSKRSYSSAFSKSSVQESQVEAAALTCFSLVHPDKLLDQKVMETIKRNPEVALKYNKDPQKIAGYVREIIKKKEKEEIDRAFELEARKELDLSFKMIKEDLEQCSTEELEARRNVLGEGIHGIGSSKPMTRWSMNYELNIIAKIIEERKQRKGGR